MSDDPGARLFVSKRAGFRCEYCQLPQKSTRVPFQLDHVIASKHEGPSDLDNLAFACLHCNCCKGPNLAGYDWERNEIVRLFNPRIDKWNDHFEWQGAVLNPRTSIGMVTIAVLRINLPKRVDARASLMAEGAFPLNGGPLGPT